MFEGPPPASTQAFSRFWKSLTALRISELPLKSANDTVPMIYVTAGNTLKERIISDLLTQ